MRDAITQYHLSMGNENPKNMYSLVGLGLLNTVPGPDSPSVKAGFAYDVNDDTYAGHLPAMNQHLSA